MSKPDPTATSHAGQHERHEIRWFEAGEFLHEDLTPCEAGWYAFACLPGCLPDGDFHGPYDTSEDADFAHHAPDSDMEQAP